MSGAYAHITIANESRARLRKRSEFSDLLGAAVSGHLGYVELGAISPDYPYLGGEHDWADLMHHHGSADFLRAGVARIQTLTGVEQEKLTAWLCGVAAHIAADVTIHPIVNLMVGPYEQNKDEHRECEMHQDAHIFARLNLGDDTAVSHHLTDTIGACGDPADPNRLDPHIAVHWRDMLAAVYPARFAKEAPKMDDWHSGFEGLLGKLRVANRLLPFARHLTVGFGLNYPKPGEADQRFIRNLRTPDGGRIDYDALFEKALANVSDLWLTIDGGLTGRDPGPLHALQNWNLDTGRAVPGGEMIFWEETV